MKTKHLFIAFVIVALAQAFVPVKMIYDSEMTEKEGAVYKFKTAPIDPNDPFRGKYVRLNYKMNSFTTIDSNWVYNSSAYITLKKDKEGFASIASISHEAPNNTKDYIIAKVQNYYSGEIHFDIGLDRYYMEESKAPEAERAYIEYSSDSLKKPAYALISVRDGKSVLQDVIIDDIPIREYVLQQREK